MSEHKEYYVITVDNEHWSTHSEIADARSELDMLENHPPHNTKHVIELKMVKPIVVVDQLRNKVYV